MLTSSSSSTAVAVVVDLFDGQPRSTGDLSVVNALDATDLFNGFETSMELEGASAMICRRSWLPRLGAGSPAHAQVLRCRQRDPQDRHPSDRYRLPERMDMAQERLAPGQQKDKGIAR